MLNKSSNRFLVVAGLILVLTGCATTSAERNSAKLPSGTDLLDLRQQAAEHYQQSRFSEAMTIYDQLIATVPEDSDLWFRKGNIHSRLKEYALADAAYEKAVLRDPRNFKAWRNLSAVQLREVANTLNQLLSVLPRSHELYASSFYLMQEVLKLIGEKPAKSKVNDALIKGTDFAPANDID